MKFYIFFTSIYIFIYSFFIPTCGLNISFLFQPIYFWNNNHFSARFKNDFEYFFKSWLKLQEVIKHEIPYIHKYGRTKKKDEIFWRQKKKDEIFWKWRKIYPVNILVRRKITPKYKGIEGKFYVFLEKKKKKKWRK